MRAVLSLSHLEDRLVPSISGTEGEPPPPRDGGSTATDSSTPPADDTSVPMSTTTASGTETETDPPPGGGPTQISDEILNPLREKIAELTFKTQGLNGERVYLNQRLGDLLIEQTVLENAIADEIKKETPSLDLIKEWLKLKANVEIELGDIDARVKEIDAELPPLLEELDNLICELTALLASV